MFYVIMLCCTHNDIVPLCIGEEVWVAQMLNCVIRGWAGQKVPFLRLSNLLTVPKATKFNFLIDFY